MGAVATALKNREELLDATVPGCVTATRSQINTQNRAGTGRFLLDDYQYESILNCPAHSQALERQ